MAGDLKLKYPAASSTLTVTNLHSLASAQDWAAGWSSASVDNTSNCYEDYLYAFVLATHASNRQAGFINIYVVAALNDTPTWPSAASGTPGTEGALSFTDTEERDAVCKLWESIPVDSTASATLYVPQKGIAYLFGGVMPTHHAIFIAQNASTTTTAGLAASGSAGYRTPVIHQYT